MPSLIFFGLREGFSQFLCPNRIRPNLTRFMVSRPKIVNYTIFQNGPSSGGTLPHKPLSYINNSCRSESLSIFLHSLMLLTGKYDLRLQIKAFFRKTMIYRFTKAKIKRVFFLLKDKFCSRFLYNLFSFIVSLIYVSFSGKSH